MAELTGADRTHLRRCVELAREALDAGDDPFGSLLVGGAGNLLAGWRTSSGLEASPVAPLLLAVVLPGADVTGPVRPYDQMMMPLHKESVERRGAGT